MPLEWNPLLRYATEALSGYDGSHDIFHAKKVVSNVLHIAEKEVKLSAIAALFHDTCDSKYVDKQSALKALSHFLNSHFCDLREDEVKSVSEVIEHVSFSKLKRLGPPQFQNERNACIWRNVSNADMLEAIGITGAIRTLMYQGHKENNLDQAINYIRNDLLMCSEYIREHSSEKKAESEALKRRDRMRQFVDAVDTNASIVELCFNLMAEGGKKTPFISVLKSYATDLARHPWLIQGLIDELRFGIGIKTTTT